MRSLTRDQFLKIFGLTSGAFDAQQRAGHVALAFETPILPLISRGSENLDAILGSGDAKRD